MDILSKVNSLNNTLPFYDLSKGVSLDNSNLYDVHLHSEYNELNNLRDYLFNFLSSFKIIKTYWAAIKRLIIKHLNITNHHCYVYQLQKLIQEFS